MLFMIYSLFEMSQSSRNEIITAKLFTLTQQHHKECLRKLFLQYYEPLVVNNQLQPNKQWTVDLKTKVKNNLRLHLTWVLKGEVFHWTDVQIGTRTLKIFHQLGKTSSSTFINHVRK